MASEARAGGYGESKLAKKSLFEFVGGDSNDVQRKLKIEALDSFLMDLEKEVFDNHRLPKIPKALDGFFEIKGDLQVNGDIAFVSVLIFGKPAILYFSNSQNRYRYWFEHKHSLQRNANQLICLGLIVIAILIILFSQDILSIDLFSNFGYLIFLWAGMRESGTKRAESLPSAIKQMLDALNKRDFERILRLEQRAISSAKDDIDLYLVHSTLGTTYGVLKRFAEAIKHYKIAVIVAERRGDLWNTQKASALTGLGVATYDLKNYEEALVIFRDALLCGAGKEPITYNIVWTHIGLCHFYSGRLEEAKKALEGCTGEHQYQDIVLGILAMIYFINDKDADKALQFLDSAYEIADKKNNNDTKIVVEFQRCKVYFSTGEKDKARECFIRGIGYPKNIIQNNFGELVRVLLFISRGKISTIKEYLELMWENLGDKYLSAALRMLLNKEDIDIVNFRTTVIELFGLNDNSDYIDWLLGEADGKPIENNGIILSIVEIVCKLRSEGRESEIEEIKRKGAIMAVPGLIYAIENKISIEQLKQKFAEEKEIVSELGKCIGLYASGKKDDARGLALSLADRLAGLLNMIDIEKLRSFIEILYEVKDLRESETRFKNIIKYLSRFQDANEVNARANYFLANIYYDAGRYDDAIRHCNETARISSDLDLIGRTNYFLGNIYYIMVRDKIGENRKEMTGKAIQHMKEAIRHGINKPFSYLILASLYGEIDEYIEAFKALAEAKKHEKELDKRNNLSEIVLILIAEILHKLRDTEDVDEYLDLFKYIIEDSKLGLFDLVLKHRGTRNNGLARVALKTLNDPNSKLFRKTKAIRLILGFNLTRFSKELIEGIKWNPQDIKKSDSLFWQWIELLRYCFTNDAVNFLNEALKINIKENQKGKIQGIIDTITEYMRIKAQIEQGKSYLTIGEWDNAMDDYVPAEEGDWDEYMLERETEKFLREFNCLTHGIIREEVKEAHRDNIEIGALMAKLDTLNKEKRGEFLSGINRLDELMEEADGHMQNKNWQAAYDLFTLAIQGDIDRELVGYEWYINNVTKDKREQIRKKISHAFRYSEQAFAFLTKGYEKISALVNEWNVKKDELRSKPPNEILDVAKNFYFIGNINGAYEIISLIPSEIIEKDANLSFWRLRFMYQSRLDGFTNELERVKGMDNIRAVFYLGKLCREMGLTQDALKYFRDAFNRAEKEGNTSLFMDTYPLLINLMGSLRIQAEGAELIKNILPKTDDIEAQISGSSILSSAGRHLEGIKVLAGLPDKTMDSEQRLAVRIQMGACYHNMNRIDSAMKWYEDALKIDRDNIRVWNNLVLIYWEKRDFNKLKESMIRALKGGYKDSCIQTLIKIFDSAINGDNNVIGFLKELISLEQAEMKDVMRESVRTYLEKNPHKISNLMMLFVGGTFNDIVSLLRDFNVIVCFNKEGLALNMGSESILFRDDEEGFDDKLLSAFMVCIKDKYPLIFDLIGEEKVKEVIKSYTKGALADKIMGYLDKTYPFLLELLDGDEVLKIVNEDIDFTRFAMLEKDILVIAAEKLYEGYGKGKLSELKGISYPRIEGIITNDSVKGKNLGELIQILNTLIDYEAVVDIFLDQTGGREVVKIVIKQGVAEDTIKEKLNTNSFRKCVRGYTGGMRQIVIEIDSENLRIPVWSALIGREVVYELVRDKVYIYKDKGGEYVLVAVPGVTLTDLEEYKNEIIDGLQRHIDINREQQTVSLNDEIGNADVEVMTDRETTEANAVLDKLSSYIVMARGMPPKFFKWRKMAMAAVDKIPDDKKWRGNWGVREIIRRNFGLNNDGSEVMRFMKYIIQNGDVVPFNGLFNTGNGNILFVGAFNVKGKAKYAYIEFKINSEVVDFVEMRACERKEVIWVKISRDNMLFLSYRDLPPFRNDNKGTTNSSVATQGMYTKREHNNMNAKACDDILKGRYIKIQILPSIVIARSEQSERRSNPDEIASLTFTMTKGGAMDMPAGIEQREREIWAGLDEETRQAVEDVSIFLLPPDSPEYPYYIRTKVREGILEEYQVAHAGTREGKAKNVFMTIQAFMELPVEIVVRILQREARLARERHKARIDKKPEILDSIGIYDDEVKDILKEIKEFIQVKINKDKVREEMRASGIALEEETDENKMELLSDNIGGMMLVHEVRYRGNIYMAKFVDKGEKNKERHYIIPQIKILKYLNGLNINGICKASHFVLLRDGRIAILFEKFPKGMDLAEKLAKLPNDKILDIMLKILYIVRELHKTGIYHWDLKAENVWVADNGEVIIFDFDFAFSIENEDDFINRGLDRAFTPTFASQKRHRWSVSKYNKGNENFPHKSSEIYSLGMILLKLLADYKLPDIVESGQTPEQFVDKQIALLKAHSIIPIELECILLKALSHGMYGYNNVDEFIADLEEVKVKGENKKRKCDLDWLIKVFESYKEAGILSEEGMALLDKAKQSGDSLPYDELNQVIEYFRNIPNMTGKEVKQRFPQKYFRNLEDVIRLSIIKDLRLKIISGCANKCFFCPVQKSPHMKCMPYPLLIMLSMDMSCPFYTEGFYYEPLYYEDVCGALFHDVMKLLFSVRPSFITHGFTDENGDLALRNIEHINSSQSIYNITISVHVTDIDYFRLKKQGKTDKEIADIYMQRYVSLIRELCGHRIDIRFMMPPKVRGDIKIKQWRKIMRKIKKGLKRELRRIGAPFKVINLQILSPRGYECVKRKKRESALEFAFYEQNYDKPNASFYIDFDGIFCASIPPRYGYPNEIFKEPLSDDKLEIIKEILNNPLYTSLLYYLSISKYHSTPGLYPLTSIYDVDESLEKRRAQAVTIAEKVIELNLPIPIHKSRIKDLAQKGYAPEFRSIPLASVFEKLTHPKDSHGIAANGTQILESSA